MDIYALSIDGYVHITLAKCAEGMEFVFLTL